MKKINQYQSFSEYEKALNIEKFGQKAYNKNGELNKTVAAKTGGSRVGQKAKDSYSLAYNKGLDYFKVMQNAEELERLANQAERTGVANVALLEKASKQKGGKKSLAMDIVTSALNGKGNAKDNAQALYKDIDFQNTQVLGIGQVWEVDSLEEKAKENLLAFKGVKDPDKIIFKGFSLEKDGITTTMKEQSFDTYTQQTQIAKKWDSLKNAMDNLGIYGDIVLTQKVNSDMTSVYVVELFAN